MEQNDTHNQYLSEIFYILNLSQNKENKTQNPINIDELITKLGQIQNKSTNLFEKDAIPIEDETALRYIEKFKKYFSLHPQLEKRFSINPSLFKESFQKHEKVILRLVMNDGVYGLAYKVNEKVYFIDGSNNTPTMLGNLTQNETEFDKEYGVHLDENLIYISNNEKTANTRKIMINYYGNFDHDIDSNLYINFIPAIIDDHSNPNNHQFTFIMYFGKKIDPSSRNEVITKDNVYYDTFQLCPPNC